MEQILLNGNEILNHKNQLCSELSDAKNASELRIKIPIDTTFKKFRRENQK
jgi:hypothetical protein